MTDASTHLGGTPSDSELQGFIANAPPASGSPERDAKVLTQYISRAERNLARLPDKPRRNGDEQQAAYEIHMACRRARLHFMRLHGEWVYSSLTDNCTHDCPLEELVFAAAEMIPGLVPTRAELDEERAKPQADKEGREIDQGIFFWGVLRVPRTGAHLVNGGLLPTLQARLVLEDFRREGRCAFGAVNLERRDGIAHLTVQNSLSLNAEDDALISAMETAVDVALLDNQTRVVVLRGGVMTHPRYAGLRVFSAGINLKDLHAGRISFVNFLLRRELGYVNKIRRGLVLAEWSHEAHGAQKPWLAAVDTFAIGGGVQLLLACDRVIAASNAYLSLPASNEGIVPGAATFRLGKLAGGRLARQMILCGRTIWAKEPDARLLVDDVVDPAQMEGAIETSARQLMRGAVCANRRLLTLVEEPIDSFRAYLAEFALEQAGRLYSVDVLQNVERAHARGAR